MKEHHALRYLLLRYLVKDKGRVSKDIYSEVTKSLSVKIAEDGSHEIEWSRHGQRHRKVYDKDYFEFYERGDHPSSSGAVGGAERKNTLHASEWSLEALSLPARGDQQKLGSPLFAWSRFELLGLVILLAPLAASLDRNLLILAVAMFIIAISEYWMGRGRFVATLVLCGLGFVLPVVAFIGALAYSVCIFLDPNPHWRSSNALVCLAAAILIFVLKNPFSHLAFTEARGVTLAVLFFMACVTFVIRWLRGTHFRFFPLVSPFLCLGLFLAGFPLEAELMTMILFVFAFIASYGHRFSPIQRERTLTPNG